MTDALRRDSEWSLFVRFDDDVAVCPHSLRSLVRKITQARRAYGGGWITLGSRTFVDEHAVFVGRELVRLFASSFVGSDGGDPQFAYERRWVFSVQALYWAVRWNASLFSNLYDSGFERGFATSTSDAASVCASYVVYHKLKNPADIRAVDYSLTLAANVSVPRVHNLTVSPTHVLEHSRLSHLPPVTVA